MKRYIRSAVVPVTAEDYEVKQDIIKDPSTPVRTLLLLRNDNDPVIRNLACLRLYDIIDNSSTDAELMALIDTQAIDLCYRISRSNNASADVLTYLFNTSICQPDNPKYGPIDNGMVPYCIADNPNTPIEILQALTNIHSNDESIDSEYWEQVRQNAKDALNSRGYNL